VFHNILQMILIFSVFCTHR